MAWIKVVGIGPGDYGNMTIKAIEAIKECDVVIGYKTYIELIKPMVTDKEIISSGMRQEVDRCRMAIEEVMEGKNVCVVSSGDAGIYGMAGLILEVIKEKGINPGELGFEVIPGVSAFNAAASLLGAPLMNDFACISLSDHLTSWGIIEKRIEYASIGDFVIVIFNPRSKEREEHLGKAQQIMLKYKSPSTPVGIVKNAGREGQSVVITELQNMLLHPIDMLTTIIVGKSDTYIYDSKIVTPRGYSL